MSGMHVFSVYALHSCGGWALVTRLTSCARSLSRRGCLQICAVPLLSKRADVVRNFKILFSVDEVRPLARAGPFWRPGAVARPSWCAEECPKSQGISGHALVAARTVTTIYVLLYDVF